MRVLRHKDRLSEVRDRRVWLIRIVWNVVLDRKRRMKTRPETDDVAELVRVLPWQGLSAENRLRLRASCSRAGLRRSTARERAAGVGSLGVRGTAERLRSPTCWALPNQVCAHGCFGPGTCSPGCWTMRGKSDRGRARTKGRERRGANDGSGGLGRWV